jgi:hypothetical protein
MQTQNKITFNRCTVREMQNATHVVSEVKNSFTTVFSVLQNLDNLLDLVKK